MAFNPLPRASLRSERPIPAARGSVATRTKPASSKRSVPSVLRTSVDADDADSGRVRVAVRIRPKNAEDISLDSDFISCVELQSELKRLKLRKNNWTSEYYRFDEVFTESASQKRVYEAVAKPVVESVLDGYNGTVMAYGQTGTGKTYTVGRLGKDDPSERGIVLRALEDILADLSPGHDTVSVSYLQLYLESIQDLLAPERTNIPIVEDPKTGEVSMPGAEVVEVKNLDQFLELLQIGDANRHAANTKLNTESSRSHAILMVYVHRSSRRKEENLIFPLSSNDNDFLSRHAPLVLKSKLLIVDLAGSERIDKSGSEGHMLEEAKFINLSLTSLGKCINALAENSPHIPTRDSKLTRLLRDSFGGTARTSLIVTIGPSARYYSETSSTIVFGQRAMKVLNTIKLKEEFDYESHCRKLEYQVDYLMSDMERLQKLRDDEKEKMEKKLRSYEASLTEADKALAEKSENQLEYSTYQTVLADTTQMYEKKVAELIKQFDDEHSRCSSLEEELTRMRQFLADNDRSLQMQQKEIKELNLKLQELSKLKEEAVTENQSLKEVNSKLLLGKDMLREELNAAKEKLFYEEQQRKHLEDEVLKLKKVVSSNSVDLEAKKAYKLDSLNQITSGFGESMSLPKSNRLREAVNGQRVLVPKIFEEVGLSNILALLKSEDLDVQIHAAKVVANLAAEETHQERIVEEGGLDALLMLLESSKETTIHRVTAGAIANLAMNGLNQGLILSKGGARLLANAASRTDDPQTLRMVAGALANLCGNEKSHVMLKEDGGTTALLEMVRSGHTDVIAQVARGIANYAKCESRGQQKGRSLLIEDGALSWIVANTATYSSSTRRHIELALCHLAQNEYNTYDIISSGAIKELVRISQESSREDICNLAKKALNSNPSFLAQMQRT